MPQLGWRVGTLGAALALVACAAPDVDSPEAANPVAPNPAGQNLSEAWPRPAPSATSGAPEGLPPLMAAPPWPLATPTPPLALPEVAVAGMALNLVTNQPKPVLRFQAVGGGPSEAVPWPQANWTPARPGALWLTTQGVGGAARWVAMVPVVAPGLAPAWWSPKASTNVLAEPGMAPVLEQVPWRQQRVDLLHESDLARLGEEAQAFLRARQVEAGGPWLLLWVGDAGSREHRAVVCDRQELSPGRWHLDFVLVADAGDGHGDPSAIWPRARYFVLGLPASFAGHQVASFSVLRERDLAPAP